MPRADTSGLILCSCASHSWFSWGRSTSYSLSVRNLTVQVNFLLCCRGSMRIRVWSHIRTIHGHTTAYYARFNIRHDALCFCGHQIPPDPLHVHDHTLHNCEHFEEHRHILSAVSRHHDPSILLGTTPNYGQNLRSLYKERIAIHTTLTSYDAASYITKPPRAPTRPQRPAMNPFVLW